MRTLGGTLKGTWDDVILATKFSGVRVTTAVQ